MENIRETHLPFVDNLLKLSDVCMGIIKPVSLLCRCLEVFIVSFLKMMLVFHVLKMLYKWNQCINSSLLEFFPKIYIYV